MLKKTEKLIDYISGLKVKVTPEPKQYKFFQSNWLKIMDNTSLHIPNLESKPIRH